MCDDIATTIADMTTADASFGPIRQERWGAIATMTMRRCAAADLPAKASESHPLGLNRRRTASAMVKPSSFEGRRH